MQSLESRIRSVDWSKYQGPEYFEPTELVEALVHLSQYNESKAKNGLDNKVLFAVGNNHAGTYYPAILEAADLIIEIEKYSENEKARKCANAILNNLYYFGPELGKYEKISYEELEKFVTVKLNEYSDET